MKISIASDLHLEFGNLDFDNPESAEVLVLSGDILIAQDVRDQDALDLSGSHGRSERFHQFMQRCSERFSRVIYVMGNHEHYHGDFATTVAHLKSKFAYISNLHILDREILTVDGVTFIGGTLWTDMNNEDPITLLHMRSMMNDFRVVQNSNRRVSFKTYEQINGVDDRTRPVFHERAAKFSPEDAVTEHRLFVDYVRTIVQGKYDQKFVVCGHHSPSKISTHPKYANDTIMNGGYSSDLNDFILNHPQIKLWTHGHTHHSFDYCIGTTRVVCNPRGYFNYEEQADQWQIKTVEI